jgi:ABC-type Fe3+ transport system permease subunit
MIALTESLWTAIGTAPIAFVVGVIVGFVLTSRYRIVRRDGNGTADVERD